MLNTRTFASVSGFALVVLAPALVFAADAGADAGDASVSNDASLANDSGPDSGSCTDGLNADALAACTGKAAGGACTFKSGVAGNCASLSCLDSKGNPILSCVTLGVVTKDAGVDSGTDDEFTEPAVGGDLGGGSCALHAIGSTGAASGLASVLALVCAAAIVARRARRK